MSRKKRALERQKKANSPQAKAKRAKKAAYQSPANKQHWEDKKAAKASRQQAQKASMGISAECPMNSWEKPSINSCYGCSLKCSYSYSSTNQ